MLRRPLVVVPLLFLAACIIPPGDREQIEDLIDDRTRAIARDDAAALYLLHDLDFRMVCSLAQFRRLPRGEAPAEPMQSIEIRGARAWAMIDTGAGSDGGGHLEFVKDSGRWYLYEDAEPCLRSTAVRDG
ncbi:MAG: hypothetical protein AB7R89_20180 [Dehalococcoidia bacterium]